MIRKKSPKRSRGKWLRLVGGTLLILLIGLIIASQFLNGWARGKIERELNTSMDGYSVTLRATDVHLISASILLHDLVISQDAHPEPAVAHLPEIHWRMQWKALIRGRIFTDLTLREPEFYFNLEQLRKAHTDSPDDEGPLWQEAVGAADYLEFNRIEIADGTLTYVDTDPDNPLEAENLQLVLENIRLSRNPEDSFPSPVMLAAVVFKEGALRIQGNADLLAIPFPAVNAEFEIKHIPLQAARPALEHANVLVDAGYLNAHGWFEYGAGNDALHVEQLTLRDLLLDYRIEAPAAESAALTGFAEAAAEAPKATESEADKESETAETVDALTSGPEPAKLLLTIDRIAVSGELGLINKTEDPGYRVFIQQLDLTLDNYSNRFESGPAHVELKGLFMGSGPTRASATFRPEQAGPDFDLAIEIHEAHLPDMNDLLESYGNFQVRSGTFSFFSEITIEEGHIIGYMRPLFGKIDVEKVPDEDDGFTDWIYDTAVDAASAVLENMPRDEVATDVDLAGPLKDPEMSTWEIVRGLLRNAFFDAILPGFESEV